MKEYLDLNNYEQQEHITYAHTRQQRTIIHISEAVSGKKGYYCMGCGRELQARKGDINIHHFAHDPLEIKKSGSCSFNNETYRHQLAKSILLRLKKIKVPDVCKYPSLERSGATFLLRSAHFITAHTAQQEIQFYEDEAGQIQYGQNINFAHTPQKDLLIQPDVAFFDETGKPILLIEMVATHRITDEKLLKIRRLGIDTVQVNVPKGSPIDIENAFSNPQKIKWVYNHEQEQADYLSISKGSYSRVSLIDEWERDLIQSIETAKCAKIRISNLIRTIGKCLESESYRIAEQAIRQQISNVEGNTLEAAYRIAEQDSRATMDRKAAELDTRYQQITANHQSEISRLDQVTVEFRERRNALENKHEGEIRAEFDNIKANIEHEIQQIETEANRINTIFSKTARETNVELEKIIRYQNISHKLLGEKFRNTIQKLKESGSIAPPELSRRISSERHINRQLDDKWKHLQSSIESGDHDVFRMGGRKISNAEAAQREYRNAQTDEAIRRTIERNQEQINRIEQEQIAIETERRKLETDFSNTIATIERKRATIELARSREQEIFDRNAVEREQRIVNRSYQNQLGAVRQEQSALSTATNNLERDFKNAINAIERKRTTIEADRSREQNLAANYTASLSELRSLQSQEQQLVESDTTRHHELRTAIATLERDEVELATFREQLSLASPKGDVCLYPRLQSQFEELLSALQHIILLGESQKGIRSIRKAQEAFESRIYKKWS